MALNVLASAPTSSCVLTSVRWVSLPAASAEASSLSCRNGLMIRPENAEANPSASSSVTRLAAVPQARRVATLDRTYSVGQPDRHEPWRGHHGGRSGDAFDLVRPEHGAAGFFRGRLQGDDLVLVQVAADPGRGRSLREDDIAVLGDDLNDAAGRQIMHPEGFLKMLDLDADAEHGRQPSVRGLERACDRCHPAAGGAAAHRVADGDALPLRQKLTKIIAVADIGAAARGGLERCPDVLAVGCRQQNVADVVGQLGLGAPQCRIVRLDVVRSGRYGLAQPDQKAVELADLVVDAGRQQAGFDQRASEGLGLVASPLVPKSTADESRERNNRGDHQSQKPRSNAAEHVNSVLHCAGTARSAAWIRQSSARLRTRQIAGEFKSRTGASDNYFNFNRGLIRPFRPRGMRAGRGAAAGRPHRLSPLLRRRSRRYRGGQCRVRVALLPIADVGKDFRVELPGRPRYRRS